VLDWPSKRRHGPPDKHLVEGRQGTLVSLQVGRALAALAVVAFHLSYAFADPRIGYEQVGFAYTRLGYLGVDYFFVLSGFIILYAHRRDIGKPYRSLSYAVKRLVRIYPIYWIITLATIAGVAFIGGTKSFPSSLIDVSSMILLVRLDDFTTPVAQAWTLFHEVLFYIFFAILIINKRLGVIAMLVWLIIILLRFQFTPHGGWSFWNTFSSFQNISFFFGMMAFWIAMNLKKSTSLIAVILGGLIFVVPLSLGLDPNSFTLGHMSYSISFMLVISGLVGVERSFGAFNLRHLELIGNASYSIYLTHEATEMVALKIAKKANVLDILIPGINYLIVFIITVIVGILVFVYIEKPMLNMLKPQATSKSNNTEQ
jgi:exopolysaccharide production protein ExoZ